MKKEKTIKILQEIGLTKNESEVYLALLILGPTTVLKVSKRTDLLRPSIYPIINSLKKKGLVKEVLTGFKKKYEAEDPDKLERALEQKRDNLMGLLPDLRTLHNTSGEDSLIQYYEGLNSLKNIHSDLLEELRPGDYYYVISKLEKLFDLDRKFYDAYGNKISKLVERKVTSLDCPKIREYIQYAKNYNLEAKILPEDSGFEADVVITPNKVIIAQLDDPISAIVIQNKTTINVLRATFLVMWNSLKTK